MTGKRFMGVASVLLILGLLAACVAVAALDAPAMSQRFDRYSRVDPARHDVLAREIVEYLCGRSDQLPSFQPHEQQHMQDVKGLFDLLYPLMALGLGGAGIPAFPAQTGRPTGLWQNAAGDALRGGDPCSVGADPF